METQHDLEWRKLDYFLGETMKRLEKLRLHVVSNSYCGEEGEKNMKAELKEIMHACGDEFDFLRLINEAKEELREDAFDRDQEGRMNGV